MYKPNMTRPKRRNDCITIIVGDFNILLNIPHLSMDRSSRQTINKGTLALNDRIDKMDLIDM